VRPHSIEISQKPCHLNLALLSESASGLGGYGNPHLARYLENAFSLKNRFRIAVFAGRIGPRVPGAKRLDSGDRPGSCGFFTRMRSGLLLAGFAIIALVVALLVGSVVALILWVGVSIVIFGLILGALFRRPRP
jgi:hypothetical protein